MKMVMEAGWAQPDSTDPGFCRFERSMLETAIVLGQVDKKFIAATLEKEDKDKGTRRRLLVLFDQHAVHERIRVEALIQGE